MLVAGGGPAGAAVAAALARAGHEVLVVERCAFPRAHVGESLAAGAWPVLAALGVADAVAARGVTVREARVRWRTAEEERVPVARGLTVDRGALDALLLAHARACGAGAWVGVEPARWPRRLPDGGWTLRMGEHVVQTQMLVDATGRQRLLGLGRPRVRAGPRTVAVHARWDPGAVARDGAQTRIDAVAAGWLWGAHIPDGSFRAMGFVDPSALRAVGGDAGRMLDGLIADSPVFADLRGRARAQAAVACDATTYASEDPIDAATAKVGEAAFAIDPLSSCGVQTALQTGLAAAAAVNTILLGNDAAAAIAFYSAHQDHTVARHSATAAGMYAQHQEHANHPFWQARARSPAPGPSGGSAPAEGPTPLASLLARRVRLAPGATMVATPCLVDDRIERRPALIHPTLDRPVAFLSGAPLAPLLDDLDKVPTLAAALTRWDRAPPAGRGHAIAAWLVARGLLEPAPVPAQASRDSPP